MNHRSEPKSCPTGTEAMIALKASLPLGHSHGLLAFVDEQPAGWCAVDPVRSQIGHDFVLKNQASISSSSWMIHCVYVDPRFRGMGISGQLIDAAIEYAKARGSTEILSFPIPEGSIGKFPKDVAEFSGRLSTFKSRGFVTQKRLDDFYQVMALSL
jgi:GNAT superfamily N-acetyltransferase